MTAIACQKSFKIPVPVAPVSLVSYYKFEEAADPTLDSTGKHNLRTHPDAIGPIVLAPGILGNCYDTQHWRGLGVDVTEDFRFLGQDFTFRVWVRMQYGGDYLGDDFLSVIQNHEFDQSWELNINRNLNEGPLLRVWDEDNDEFNVKLGSLLPPGWHHIVCWRKHGVEVGMRIDDSWQQTTPFLKDIYMPTQDQLRVVTDNGGGHNYVDELGIWGRAWTPAEITWDYNAGNGRTYPNVPA